MLYSRQAVTLRWIFVTLLGIGSLQTGVGIEALVDCTPYQCCLDECCGPDTSWDDSIEYCVPDAGASGYIAIFAPELSLCVQSERAVKTRAAFLARTMNQPFRVVSLCRSRRRHQLHRPLRRHPIVARLSPRLPTRQPKLSFFPSSPQHLGPMSVVALWRMPPLSAVIQQLVTKQKVEKTVMSRAVSSINHRVDHTDKCAGRSLGDVKISLRTSQGFPLTLQYFHRRSRGRFALGYGGNTFPRSCTNTFYVRGVSSLCDMKT